MGKEAEKSWKSIKQKEYDNIKLLQQAGLKVSQAVKITGRSYVTVSNVYKSKTLEDYKTVQQPKETTTTQVANTIDQTLVFRDLLKLLNNMASKLEDIETSVKWIENHTEVKPQRRFF